MNEVRVKSRQFLELISNGIPTSYEGDTFDDTVDNYQRVDLLPSVIEDIDLEREVKSYILQITLYYKANAGTYEVEKRAEEIVTHFADGTQIEECLTVRGVPEIRNLGTINNHIVRIVTVNLFENVPL